MSNDLRSIVRNQLLKILSEGDVVDLSQYKSGKSQFGQMGTTDKKIYYLVLDAFIYYCQHVAKDQNRRYVSFNEINTHPSANTKMPLGKMSSTHYNNMLVIIEVDQSFQEEMLKKYDRLDDFLHSIFIGSHEDRDYDRSEDHVESGHRTITVNIIDALNNFLGISLT